MTDPVTTHTATTTTAPQKSPAEVLFPDQPVASPDPEPVGGLRAWSPNMSDLDTFGRDHPAPREMFSPETALAPTMRQREAELMEVLDLGQVERVARHREFVATVRDSGLDAATTGIGLYTAMTDAQLAVARGEVPDDATTAAVYADLNRQLRVDFGAERGERIARAVGAFVKAHAGLQRVLVTPGIETRATFRQAFEQIIDHVRRQQHL
jgi:hypothetical protein